MKIVSNDNDLSVEIVSNYEIVVSNGKEQPQTQYISVLGGDTRNLSWEEYLDEIKDDYKPHILLLKKTIQENGLIGYTGKDAEQYTFKFSDGIDISFTWRGWGDLMAAIVDKREGYIAYYM